MFKNIILAALVIGSTAMLSGCAPSLKGDVYSREDARTPQVVLMGTIETLRPVQIEGTKTAIGAGAGAAVGGIAGSSVGSGKGGYVAAVIGAVAGGLLGAAAEEGLRVHRAWKLRCKKIAALHVLTCRKLAKAKYFESAIACVS